MRRIVDMILHGAITVFFAAMVGLVFLSVVARYFGIRTSVVNVGEEASRFLFIWLSFLGAALATRENSHIRIEALLVTVPEWARRMILTVADLFSLLFLGITAYFGFRLLPFTRQPSAALGVPMWVVYACVPVSFVLMIFYLIPKVVERLRAKHGS